MPAGKLQTKEIRAIEYYTNPISETYMDWNKSYLRAKYSECHGWRGNAWKVRNKDYIMAEIDKKLEENKVKSDITREYLVDKLNDIVLKPDSQSVKVAAIREIGTLLGFQREPAENPENQAQRKVLDDKQRELIRKVAAEIVQRESEKGTKPSLRLTTA
ncbi:MAG: hypothetical protein ACYS1A_16455 [Planctomycetota bacterium]